MSAGVESPAPLWTTAAGEALTRLATSPQGLSEDEARARLKQHGPNELAVHRGHGVLGLLYAQVKSPLMLLLLFASIVSIAAGEWVDASMTMGIVIASALIGFWRELKAGQAIEKLKARAQLHARVLRDGKPSQIPAREVVRGDLVLLSAGSLIPADGLLVEANDFFVNQALLTGETLPVEKSAQPAPDGQRRAERKDAVFAGTSVRSGFGKAVILDTGRATIFGGIADKLQLRPPETEFDRGLRQFGELLLKTMLAMVVGVLVINGMLGRPIFDSMLFAIALAVGLAPEMLPAVLAVNLAKSAQSMAAHGVLVRRLTAIENLGSMDVLCTDKTGTLTEGEIRLEGSWDPEGAPSPSVLRLAALNAHFETGLDNPLDDAIEQAHPVDPAGIEKLGEIPFDFRRKRLSVIVREGGRVRLITKGALERVLDACLLAPAEYEAARARALAWGTEGIRVLAVASAEVPVKGGWHAGDEQGLTFEGFLTFFDPPKQGVREAIAELGAGGVTLKVISGDARAINLHLAAQIGLPVQGVLTGSQLDLLSDEALWARVESTNVFAEVDPNQKERIILALKKRRHVVGYLGDGINDAPALHAADVSISVDSAVDVAKDAADFVLLERDLSVLRRGILEGRTTFANTSKYVLTTTSANLGNMLSMAAATLFLPYLPLLASQILLNNLLSDLPAMALANDKVDPELIARPRRWDPGFIRRFMVQFGLVSALFDLITFAALLTVFHAGQETFRTAWFVVSLLTELAIALVVRTRRPALTSRPSFGLLAVTVAVAAVALTIPYLPGVKVLGFVPLAPGVLFAVVLVTAAYVGATEVLKRWFYRPGGPNL